MSTHKYIDRICVAVLVFSLILTMLFMNGTAFGIEKIVDEDSEAYTGSKYFTSNDLNGAWDTSNATKITLNGTGGKVYGPGAYAYDSDIMISGGGYYVISGQLTDGSIIVDAYSSSKVWILLDGVDITCADDACIRVNQADKVFLTLAEGSQNCLSSGSTYSEEALSDGTDGAVFAHDDLTINGSGSLTVSAEYKHGIAANDDLVIAGGTIVVDAKKDAIRANDSIRLVNASVTVTAQDDGVVVSGDNGYLYVESGSLDITSADDGIHTSSDITIAGGNFTIQAGDDGIHSDTTFTISDGNMLIPQCYEGIEAVVINIGGGDIAIYPSDDGLNANGGSSQMGFGGMGGFGGGMRDMRQNADMQSADSDSVSQNSPNTNDTGSTEMSVGQNGKDNAGAGNKTEANTETDVSVRNRPDSDEGDAGRPRDDSNFGDVQESSGDSNTREQVGSGDTNAGDAQESSGESNTGDVQTSSGEINTGDAQASSSDTNAAERQTGSGDSNLKDAQTSSGDTNAGETQTGSGDTNAESAQADSASAGTGDDSGNVDNSQGTEEELEPCIRISGGTLTIVNDSGQDADGIDSNKDIYISGGTIYVSLVNSGSNSAVDYGSENSGVCEISGGSIIACGASGMAESFDASSSQCSVLYTISEGVEAGTTLEVENEDGEVLLSYEVPNSFSSALLSCPQMQLGETYRITAGDKEEEIMLEEVSSTAGDIAAGMFGGNGNGGMQRRGGFGGGNHTRGEAQNDGNQTVSGNMPWENGEMPGGGMMPWQNGDQTVSGNMPWENGEMPGGGMMPGQNGDQTVSGNMPWENGEMPGGGMMPGQNAGQSVSGNMPQMDGNAQQIESETDSGVETGQEETGVSRTTWVLLASSVAVLLFGLLFAVKFKQKTVF